MNSQSIQNSGSGGGNSPAISEAEFQALVEMVGSDAPEVLVDLLDTYLVESAGLVEAIREGLDSGQTNNMLRPSHSLKSSSASIGAMRLSKLCADLESYLRGSLPDLNVPGQVEQIESEFARVQEALVVERAKFNVMTPRTIKRAGSTLPALFIVKVLA
jgi:HPt (histidine-containing phosphotransfer) domain-containing protein